MEDLLARRRALDAARACTKLQLKRARQSLRDGMRAEVKAWRLSDALRRSVLIVYVLADYNIEVAARFLAAGGRKRHWPERSEEELAAVVEHHFLETSAAELASLTDTEDPSDVASMKAALSYVGQWRLVGWATGLNVAKGVAPSTEAVLHRLEAQRLELPEAVRPDPRGTITDARARVWASAWRKRWGARHGRIRIREDVTLEDMRHKAGTTQHTARNTGFAFPRAPFADPKLVPYSGPVLGPRLCLICCFLYVSYTFCTI
jgi:hypothetical protein